MHGRHSIYSMLATILQHYDIRPLQTGFLAQNGGFSGAQFWRVEDEEGVWCLRCWPQQHPSSTRLREIHDTLLHVARSGFTQAAIPRVTNQGRTFVEEGGRLWELAPWMSGAPHRTTPAPPARIASAMEMLADFHTATQSLAQPPQRVEAIGRRIAQLQAFTQQYQDCLQHSAALPVECAAAGRRILQGFPAAAHGLAPHLHAAQNLTAAHQPCLRDVWRDNVLFTSDRATGLVDFGALQMGAVALDVSRLLGSLAGDDGAAWQHGLTAYERRRPLTPADQQLIPLLDRCFVVMAGMQWLIWLCLEGRKFDNPAAVGTRLCEIADRLEHDKGDGLLLS